MNFYSQEVVTITWHLFMLTVQVFLVAFSVSLALSSSYWWFAVSGFYSMLVLVSILNITNVAKEETRRE